MIGVRASDNAAVRAPKTRGSRAMAHAPMQTSTTTQFHRPSAVSGSAPWMLGETLIAPLFILLLLTGVTLYAWKYKIAEERAQTIDNTLLLRAEVAKRIERIIDDAIRPMRRLAREFDGSPAIERRDFQDSAASVPQVIPQNSIVALVDARGQTLREWNATPGEVVATTNPSKLDPAIGWESGIAHARSTRNPMAIEAPFEHEDPNLLYVILPMSTEAGDSGPAAMVAQLDLRSMLTDLLSPSMAARYRLILSDPSDHSRVKQGDESASIWIQALEPPEPIRILDATWKLRLVPGSAFNHHPPFGEPVWILIVGGTVSALATGTVLQTMLHRRRDRQRTGEHLAAVQALNEVSAALTASPDAGSPVLDQLAAELQRFLRMPMAAVLLLEPDNRNLRIVYSSGADQPLQPLWDLDRLPSTRQAIETGESLLIPDVDRAAPGIDVSPIRPYGIRAIFVMPMVVNGRPLGLIVLCDRVRHRLSDLEARMARLWTAQAAVILAQRRLYEQLRQQVERNELLLRELNHRVKNNLAGIYGLLVMDQPALSPDARRWVDRVVARVETMTRAHELFSGGVPTVGLEDLVHKTLASIHAIKPPGVRVQVDVAQVQAPLSTDRAVTLAIVLNELCYNSLIHGVGANGTLTVRGRHAANERIAIEIIDERGNNGEGGNPSEGVMRSTGVGLSLVQALVGRELRGELSITETATGGTRATVEFPATTNTSTGVHP